MQSLSTLFARRQETQMSFNLQYLQLENEMVQPAAPRSYVG
jgi:hypothetical protein